MRAAEAIKKSLIVYLCAAPHFFASSGPDRREFPRPGQADRGRFEFSFALHCGVAHAGDPGRPKAEAPTSLAD
jgi:hypothetical protein